MYLLIYFLFKTEISTFNLFSFLNVSQPFESHRLNVCSLNKSAKNKIPRSNGYVFELYLDTNLLLENRDVLQLNLNDTLYIPNRR